VIVIAQRVLRLLIVTFIVTLFTALLLQLVPGSPAQLIAGEGASPEALRTINHQYGFDKPVFTQYINWMKGLFTGDLGTSYRSGAPVWNAIKERAPVTAELAIGAIVLALVLAVPLALLCAYRAGRFFDRVVEAITSVMIAIPPFLSALLFSYVFAISLAWFPVTGWVSLTDDPVGNIEHAVIPIVALALPAVAVFQRVLRADVIATLQEDHIALARAKGVSSTQIMLRHALRPSSFSLLTVAGLQLAGLVGGTVIIETLFALPGLGSLLVQSVLGHDLVTVQGLVVVLALSYLLVNLIVDISYRLIDPRVSIQ